MEGYSYLNNADPAYIESLYEEYSKNPEGVEQGWRSFFEGYELAASLNGHAPELLAGTKAPAADFEKEAIVWKLIYAYRERAHLLSDTNPIRPRRNRHPHLDLSDFGLTEADLPVKFNAAKLVGLEEGTLQDIINHLRQL